MRSISSHLAAIVAAALGLAACGDDDGPDMVTPAMCARSPSEKVECARVEAVVTLRSVPFPGKGADIAVRLVDACGTGALPASYASCMDVDGAETTPRPLGTGYTLILATAPADDAQVAATLQTIEQIVAARPANERVALHRLGPSVEQISDFTSDHARLIELARANLVRLDGGRAAMAEALAQARKETADVGGSADLVARNVVVISAEEPAEGDVPHGATLVAWVAPGGDVAKAMTAIDAANAQGAIGVGVCGASEMSVRANGRTFDLGMPPSFPEEDRLTCDAAKAARGERTYGKRVEFIFDDAQRANYLSLMETRSRRDFPVSIKIGDADPIPGTAHLRGHGTMLCDRKAYSVNLEADGKRMILPGVKNDEFILQSMCWDQAYIENFSYGTVMRGVGIFPFQFDYVELIIDGEQRGVYLLMEKPHEALKQDHARGIGVVRRNHEGIDDPLDVKIFREGAEEYLVPEYDAILATAETVPGQEGIDRLRELFALDHFIRYMATMTILHNSDYGDEIRFMGTERIASPRTYFEVSAWDPEDMMRNDCVWYWYAYEDPNGLVWCAEGRLEHALLNNPVGYAMYVDTLEQMLPQLTPDKLIAAMDLARSRLVPFFGNQDIVNVMTEMEVAPTTEAYTAEVDRRIRIIKRRFETWHAELGHRINIYRSTSP